MKNMGSLKKIYILPLCLLFCTGCNQEDTDVGSQSNEILLNVDGIASSDGVKAVTRAAVDQWDNTVVSIAYAYGTALFDRSLSVTLSGDQDKHVKTGMEYPFDETPVSFVGYHPASPPNEQGIVGYDLSAGDRDIMLSNALSGTQSGPINGTMQFEHQLTRFTFIMKCKSGASYPETVHGVRASANSSDKLMTYVHINLNNRKLNFSFPGQVTSSIPEGAVVPAYNAPDNALLFDLMLQPEVPVKFEVITLTDIKQFSIPSNTVWDQLLSGGGQAGKQYTVRLWFSGEEILADGISITPWAGVVDAYSAGTWW